MKRENTLANKYILKVIDENKDEMSASVTYEFTAEYIHSVLDHITNFLRVSGYSWLESLETIEEDDDVKVERTEPENDQLEKT